MYYSWGLIWNNAVCSHSNNPAGSTLKTQVPGEPHAKLSKYWIHSHTGITGGMDFRGWASERQESIRWTPGWFSVRPSNQQRWLLLPRRDSIPSIRLFPLLLSQQTQMAEIRISCLLNKEIGCRGWLLKGSKKGGFGIRWDFWINGFSICHDFERRSGNCCYHHIAHMLAHNYTQRNFWCWIFSDRLW